jgi:hypothetical protein
MAIERAYRLVQLAGNASENGRKMSHSGLAHRRELISAYSNDPFVIALPGSCRRKMPQFAPQEVPALRGDA